MSENRINVAQISGTQNSAGMTGELGAGALIVNDYRISTEPIDGGHRLTVKRGSEVQTMDLLDGAPGAAGPQGEPGPVGPQGIPGEPGPQGEPGQDAPQESVLYTPQTLTEAQQAQARENVGAASAERVEAVADALPGKLSEPSEGLAVGKYFRVAAIDENGHAVLEEVDAPKEGLAITPTGWPEWTADEQAAARERMGIPGDYELIHDETITEDIAKYDIENVSLKKVIILFYSVSHTSDNHLLLDFHIDGKTNKYNGPTVKAINKNGHVTEYFCYFDGGVFHNFSIGPAVYGGTRNNINTFYRYVTGERITGIYLRAYTESEVIPTGCIIKIYGVRA